MLETIAADEVDLHGTALAVRCRTDPSRPELRKRRLTVIVFRH
jgi:hypothetical protein